jgi:two-component system LytT family response regulator
VIFTTAYDKFALRAFEVHALDYLLKPFDRDRFREAVRRAKDRLAKPAPSEGLRELLAELRPETKPSLKRLTVKSVGSVTFVDLDQIDWLESADNYVNIHTVHGERLIRETLAALEERLPAEQFVRISRSTIVALDRVKELQPLTNGGCTVILRNGARLTLSRGYRDKLPVLKGEPA